MSLVQRSRDVCGNEYRGKKKDEEVEEEVEETGGGGSGVDVGRD